VSVTRRTFLAASAAATTGLPAAIRKRPVINPPNILLILAEDLASWMLGCYGNKEIQTPNIDALARRSVRFGTSLASAPIGSSSRASLFSGRTPMQHRVYDQSLPESFKSEVLLTDLLAGQGYDVGYAGNWHIGDGQNPGHGIRWAYTNKGGEVAYQNPNMLLNGQPVVEQGYLTEILTRRATEFLDQQKPAAKPFFLTVAYYHPTPADHPQKYDDIYSKTSFDTIGWAAPARNASINQDLLKDTVASIRRCAASITALDGQLPPLFAKLRERGLENNTLVIFTSDHGYMTGQHGLWGAGTASEPINMFEESMLVPMIWAWPGHTPVQTLRPELVTAYDFLPTICEAAGADVPAKNLCGRSYLPLVTGKPLPKKHPWPSTVFGNFRDVDMARDTRFKLVLRNEGKGPNELFDLKSDAHERVNQFANPGYVSAREQLRKELTAWKKQYSV
jgi:arylsulfatase A-like enzyme